MIKCDKEELHVIGSSKTILAEVVYLLLGLKESFKKRNDGSIEMFLHVVLRALASENDEDFLSDKNINLEKIADIIDIALRCEDKM